MLLLVVILLILFGFGGPLIGPRYGYGPAYYGYPSLLLVVLLILLLFGAFGGGPVWGRHLP